MDAAAKRRVSKIGQQLDENDRQGLLLGGGEGGGWLNVGGGGKWGEAWLGQTDLQGIVEIPDKQILKRASYEAGSVHKQVRL